MGRRGIGHVEAILSFILFIGFVSVALFFFVPTDSGNLVGASLDYAISGIIANTAVDVETYSVKIFTESIPSGQEAIAIEFPPEVSEIPYEYKVRAETYEGEHLPATRDGNIIYVKNNGAGFVILKFSADLEAGQPVTQRPAENPAYYQIASSSKKKVLSEGKLLELNGTYYEDYEGLSDRLGIPDQVSFAFYVDLPDGRINAERPIPAGVEVHSSLSRRELLMQKDGSMVFGEVNVRVW